MDARMIALALADGMYAFFVVVGFCAAALAAFSIIVIVCTIISKIMNANGKDNK